MDTRAEIPDTPDRGSKLKLKAVRALGSAVYTLAGWLDQVPHFELTQSRDSKGRPTAFSDEAQMTIDDWAIRQKERLPKEEAIQNALTAMKERQPVFTVLGYMGGYIKPPA